MRTINANLVLPYHGNKRDHACKLPWETWSTQTFNGNLILPYHGNTHDYACKFEVIIELYHISAFQRAL